MRLFINFIGSVRFCLEMSLTPSEITNAKEVAIVVTDNNDTDNDKGKHHNGSVVSRLATYMGVELTEDSEQPPKISLFGKI